MCMHIHACIHEHVNACVYVVHINLCVRIHGIVYKVSWIDQGRQKETSPSNVKNCKSRDREITSHQFNKQLTRYLVICLSTIRIHKKITKTGHSVPAVYFLTQAFNHGGRVYQSLSAVNTSCQSPCVTVTEKIKPVTTP